MVCIEKGSSLNVFKRIPVFNNLEISSLAIPSTVPTIAMADSSAFAAYVEINLEWSSRDSRV